MDTTVYANVLKENLAICWILFLVALICTIISEKSYLHGGKKRNEAKKAREYANVWAWITIVAFAYCLYVSVPIVVDICNNDYISVHGEFRKNESRFRTYAWITTDDGADISIKIPIGHSRDFPSEEGQVTIWYAENSRYIVAFIPDKDIDDSD